MTSAVATPVAKASAPFDFMPKPKQTSPISVVQPWLAYCSLKQQTVVLVALRGCDGLPKEDPSKKLVRVLRATVLLNADSSTEFMVGFNHSEVTRMTGAIDHYPVHWLTHFMHAAEIIGYKHPVAEVKAYWSDAYRSLVTALHLNVETEEELDDRL